MVFYYTTTVTVRTKILLGNWSPWGMKDGKEVYKSACM